jgi:type I restriction enzyme R subunit
LAGARSGRAGCLATRSLQVINQYEVDGAGAGVRRANWYDVTILVNGLPLVHVELKRRGVALKEAFNQTTRYQREPFWSDSGLFDYVQLFAISNGTPRSTTPTHNPRPAHEGS